MTTQAPKAIQTHYKGYKFRSRTEARWAVFFDALGIEWEYEKEGYKLDGAGWYLPDFWLPGLDVWIEIKGGLPTDAELMKAKTLCEATEKPVYIFAGSPWFNIARAVFVICGDGAEDCSYYDKEDAQYYDYEQMDGRGTYYQGWETFGETQGSQIGIIALVEGCDQRDANTDRITRAYRSARSARFEHGEAPQEQSCTWKFIDEQNLGWVWWAACGYFCDGEDITTDLLYGSGPVYCAGCGKVISASQDDMLLAEEKPSQLDLMTETALRWRARAEAAIPICSPLPLGPHDAEVYLKARAEALATKEEAV